MDDIIDLYISGYNCNEIAAKVFYHAETVREALRRFKDTLSDEDKEKLVQIHRKSRQNKFGEIIRFNKKLRRKYMRTSEAVRRNQSAYKLNKNRTGVVFNKKVGARPVDLPSSY